MKKQREKGAKRYAKLVSLNRLPNWRKNPRKGARNARIRSASINTT